MATYNEKLKLVKSKLSELQKICELCDEKNIGVRAVAKKDIDTSLQLTVDLLQFTCFISATDGELAQSEVKAINDLLELNLSDKDVFEVLEEIQPFIIYQDNHLPEIFKVFLALDMQGFYKQLIGVVPTIKLLDLLVDIAAFMIDSDSAVQDIEINKAMSFIKRLKEIASDRGVA